MRDSLSYQGYVGSVHFNADDEVSYGKIVGVDGLVTFEGTTVADLAASFRDAAEDCTALCRSIGKPARKSYKGSFNVRIPASLHRRAAEQATVRGTPTGSAVLEPFEPPALRLCLDRDRGGYRRGWQTVPVPHERRYYAGLDSRLAAIRGAAPPERSLDHELTVQASLLRAVGLA